MLSRYGLDVPENCQTCPMRHERPFCNLEPDALQEFETIKSLQTHPAGTVLFLEGERPGGIFVLCKGHVKMSICASGGKRLVVRISEPGEVLGLSAALSGKPYELSAETAEPCQVSFVQRDDLMRLLRHHVSVCLAVAEQLSEKYRIACRGIRDLAGSHADQRLAKLLLQWNDRSTEGGKAADHLDLSLTQEAIGQAIGTTRETVVRLLADLKERQIIAGRGSTIVICDQPGLRKMAGLRNRLIN